LLYERVFENDITKELQIYGLDGDDVFQVTGKVSKGLLVRLIGGDGKDEFIDESKVTGLKRKTKIYDNEYEESKLSLSKDKPR